MPTYHRFEDLPVWRASADLYDHADDFLGHAPARLRASFRDQLERAVLSISNNIAEGFERGTTNELLSFLYIARGSAGEVRSMLTLLRRRPWVTDDLKSEISDLISLAESCSRQLAAWAQSLQNGDITGVRHLTDKSRQAYQRRKDQAAGATQFQQTLREHLPSHHPLHPKNTPRPAP